MQLLKNGFLEKIETWHVGLSCQYTHFRSLSSKSEHDTIADQATLSIYQNWHGQLIVKCKGNSIIIHARSVFNLANYHTDNQKPWQTTRNFHLVVGVTTIFVFFIWTLGIRVLKEASYHLEEAILKMLVKISGNKYLAR